MSFMKRSTSLLAAAAGPVILAARGWATLVMTVPVVN
jgi:hypothetical protein